MSRGLPQHVHHHRPGQPVGAEQHDRVDRAARRLDRRLHRVYAATAALDRSRRRQQAEDELGRACQRGRRHARSIRRPNSWYMGANIRASRASSCPISAAAVRTARRCDEVAANGYEGFVLGSAERPGRPRASGVRIGSSRAMADDGRTHLQEILGARVSELSESSARVLTAFIDGGRPNAHLPAVTQARHRYDETAQRSAPVSRSPRSISATSPSQAPTARARLFRPRHLPAAGDRLHPRRRLAARQHRSHQAACRALANAPGARVFSVGYRLAPESRFPTAVEDCYAALTWVHAHADALSIDSGRIAVAGDSAGGNLATAISTPSRDAGGPRLSMQLLVYPVTTTNLSLGFRRDARGIPALPRRNAVASGQLSRCAGAEDRSVRLAAGPRTSLPACHQRSSSPRSATRFTHRVSCTHARCRPPGVTVEHRQWPGALHGFFQFPNLFTDGAEAVAAAAVALSAPPRRPTTVLGDRRQVTLRRGTRR